MLNTAEAARFLRVSQASVRRWFDAGLLPGHRVGRRGERRFQEKDLVAFLNHGVSAAPGTPTVKVAGTDASLPLHVLSLFSSDLGGLRMSLPFLAEGVRLREPCFLVATGPSLERYTGALGSTDGIEVVHFGGGVAEDAIEQWEHLFAGAVADGARVIRVVGEMAAERPMFTSEDEMLRYEEAFEVMCRRYPVAVICQYDAREFAGISLLRALKAHPDLYGFRIGAFLN